MSERINTPCPACGSTTLFIAHGGYLTCGLIPGRDGTGGCPDPLAADRMLTKGAETSRQLREALAFIAAHECRNEAA
jgi:hypothetical protein